MGRIIIAASLMLFLAPEARAHYHMLIPDKHSVKTGEEVVITYQFGHPFEKQLFDASAPTNAFLHQPDGQMEDITAKFKKVEVPGEDKKNVAAYRLSFKPEHRGDYIVSVAAPAVELEGEKRPVRDVVKVVVHVQAQKGWDAATAHRKDQFADLVPLTRPYALRSGMLFRAAFKKIDGAAPLGGAEVEIERYNPEPPKQLPPEEHTTYTARTDAQGILATTLPDAGWWAVTAIHRTPQAVHRCTMWIPVDGKIPLKPAD
jgi:cobalt/nickel transport protein